MYYLLTMASFTDRSTECAICLGSLNSSNDNADDTEDAGGGGNSSSSSRSTTGSNTQTHNETVITLGCGHRYHLACIITQIEVGSMKAQNDDQRLLFSSIQCAQCGRIFHDDEHPELLPTELIRATDRRRAEVDRLLLAHNLVSLLPVGPPPRGATAATTGVAAAALSAPAPAGVVAALSVPATSRHHHHKHTPWDEREREARFREARRKYAFYLCSHCDCVYFGGTVACADGIPPPQSAAVTNHRPEQRLCPACVPQAHSISGCTNPVDHGQYLTWKCRYCCQPATHVCYGGVHFCDACHANNSQRVAMAERYDTNAHHHRPRLEAIPCPGNACPYPKPSNTNTNTNDATAVLFHTNGATQDCEQVYSCAICDSSSLFENNASRYSPGSYNFLYNPNGEFGVQGWKPTSRNHRMWQVEQRRQYRHEQQSEQHQINNTNHTTDDYIPEEPVLYVVSENSNGTNTNNTNSTTNDNSNTNRIPITTNFVSSFTDCVMMQSIDLSRVLRLDNTNTTTTTTDISNLTPSLSSNNDEHEEVNSTENENHHDEEENEAETAGVINDNTIIPIEISARYTGRDDCPSVFMLQAVLSDGTMHTNSSSSSGSGQEGRHDRLRTTDRLTSGILEAPPGNYWERTSLTFRVSLRELKTTFRGRPIITVIVYGKDTRFWQGNFGSKVADLSVRVLGNSTFLETVVVPAAVAVPAPSISARDGAMVANNATAAVVGHTTIYKRLVWDFLVPVAIFTVLAWLARE